MIPLAEQMRPRRLEDYVGQQSVVEQLKRFIASGSVPSFILWGPPGVGKTTLATILANSLGRQFFTLSAVNSGVKDVREVLEKARNSRFFESASPILFIDEIHRFNKSQQDSLLGAVEQGVVTLIGATTENPSFEVIRPLLSRCAVYVLRPLDDDDLLVLLHRAVEHMAVQTKIVVEQTDAILALSGGDARKLLNIVQALCSTEESEVVINNETVTRSMQQSAGRYDKGGEEHYDTISAFIKSVRGSDPQAAIYYLARMLAGGEQPRFIARRMSILAAEDIGLANPNALLLANACFDVVHNIGMPEARIPLAEVAIYLANSPKSNSAYVAINEAMRFIEQDGYRPVPLHLRNAPTELMKHEGYGAGYKYSHNYAENFVRQQFMPDGLEDKEFWMPSESKAEQEMSARYIKRWKQ